MKLTEKTPEGLRCIAGACPAIYETDRDTYVLIGPELSPGQLKHLPPGKVGDGDRAIEVPKDLLGQL